MAGIEKKQDNQNVLLHSKTDQPVEDRKIGRRSVIKKMAIGTAALAGCSVLPEKWTSPLVEFGTLPAHATTSGSLESMIEELKQEIEAADTPEAAAAAEQIEQVEQVEQVALAEAPQEELHSNEVKIMNTGQKMSWDSYYYDKFVFPKRGPEYTSQSFDLVYSDGNTLHVPDPENMVMTADNMKYQPGGRYSGNNPDIPTMEVYARRDTHPDWVKAVFQHNV
jgi:hypothetical protein